MDKSAENWWTRACGGREVVALAWPLVISTMSFTLMHFCDRMFLTWHSLDEQAAALPAGMLNWTLFSFPLGIAVYVNTFVAQYHGANRPNRIGLAVFQGVFVGIACIPIFLLVAKFSPQIFGAFGHTEDLVKLEATYLQTLAWGAGAAVIGHALSSFFIGLGRTRTVMYVNFAAAGLNIVLDYVWVFGYLGFPEGGIEGAAWATVVSQWFKVGAYYLLMMSRENIARFDLLKGRRLDFALMWRLIRFGGPNGLQFFIEGNAITLFVLLVGQVDSNLMTQIETAQTTGQQIVAQTNLAVQQAIGVSPMAATAVTATNEIPLQQAAIAARPQVNVNVAATAVAFNVNMVAFIPMIGMGMAVSTLVGQQLGKNRPELAARATWTGVTIGLMYTTFFGVTYLMAPDLFLIGHAAGADAQNFDAIRGVTHVLLRFVAAYCLLDAMQILFVSALKGAGDTRFILGVAIVTSGAFMFIGWAGSVWWGFGLYEWWTVLTVYICVLGGIYLLRFLQGKWRTMRVIEAAVIPDKPVSTDDVNEAEPALAE